MRLGDPPDFGTEAGFARHQVSELSATTPTKLKLRRSENFFNLPQTLVDRTEKLERSQ